MKGLAIGQMRYEIAIQQKTQTRDSASGAWSESWATVRTTRAKREYRSAGSGEGYEDDLQKMGTQTVAFTIRKLGSDLSIEDNRLLVDGDVYDIAEIRPSGYGERFLLLIAEIRNNDE